MFYFLLVFLRQILVGVFWGVTNACLAIWSFFFRMGVLGVWKEVFYRIGCSWFGRGICKGFLFY